MLTMRISPVRSLGLRRPVAVAASCRRAATVRASSAALSRSARASEGETPVAARTSDPRTSWATFSNKALSTPEVRSKEGFDFMGDTVEGFTALIQRETALVGRLVKSANIRSD